jgi:hypothetical protein
MSAHRELARGLRAFTERSIDHHVSDLTYAVVRSVSPLSAEHEDGVLLDEDDLVLGVNVRQYDAFTGLAVDDTLVVKQMRDGDWLAVDVLSGGDVVVPAGGGNGGGGGTTDWVKVDAGPISVGAGETVTTDIPVTATGRVGSVELSVWAPIATVYDIELTLGHPDGTEKYIIYSLANSADLGSGSPEAQRVRFGDGASRLGADEFAIEANPNAPWAGWKLLPYERFAGFANKPMAGAWTLRAQSYGAAFTVEAVSLFLKAADTPYVVDDPLVIEGSATGIDTDAAQVPHRQTLRFLDGLSATNAADGSATEVRNLVAPTVEASYQITDDDLYHRTTPGYEGWTTNAPPAPGVWRIGNWVTWIGLVQWVGETTGYPYSTIAVVRPDRIPAEFRPHGSRTAVVAKDIGGGDAPWKDFYVYIESDGSMAIDTQHTNGTAGVDQLAVDDSLNLYSITYPVIAPGEV